MQTLTAPRISVRAIMRTHSGEICLIRRVKAGDEYWTTPGGGVEDGESHSQALIREMREETGARIERMSPQPVCELRSPTQIQLFFTCYETERGAPTGAEHLRSTPDNLFEVCYVPITQLDQLKIVPAEIKAQIITAALALE